MDARDRIALRGDATSDDLSADRGRYLRARDWQTTFQPPEPEEGDYVVVDDYGRILAVASAVARRFGFTIPRLLGKRLTYRLGVASRTPFQAALAGLRSGIPFDPIDCDGWTKTFEPLRLTLSMRRKSGSRGEGTLLGIRWRV